MDISARRLGCLRLNILSHSSEMSGYLAFLHRGQRDSTTLCVMSERQSHWKSPPAGMCRHMNSMRIRGVRGHNPSRERSCPYRPSFGAGKGFCRHFADKLASTGCHGITCNGLGVPRPRYRTTQDGTSGNESGQQPTNLPFGTILGSWFKA